MMLVHFAGVHLSAIQEDIYDQTAIFENISNFNINLDCCFYGKYIVI